jgi:hypothetical protein
VFEDERERKKFFKKMSKKEPQGSGGGVGKDFSLEAGSHCVAQAYLSLLVSSISPTSASSVAGITGLHHNAQLSLQGFGTQPCPQKVSHSHPLGMTTPVTPSWPHGMLLFHYCEHPCSVVGKQCCMLAPG